ncbi:MAG TPA: hypothetical protein VGQ53_24510, partial [Chitinophagaceae bacterium]|nr:hypothetical protein [Chitinophagaceae bacterium]
LILLFRLFVNRSFLALAICYFIVGVQNLMRQSVFDVPKSIYQTMSIVDNILDAPLMLLFLIFFSTSALMTKRIRTCIYLFIAFEAIILAVFGFNVKAIRIILGPDIVLIVTISFLFFLRYVRLSVSNGKSLGKAVMASSVFISYTIFSIVYVFYYLLKNQQYQGDAELIYYLISILSAMLMSIGIHIENKRFKKLDELRHTRKELAAIYGEKKVAAFKKDSRFLNS